MRTWFWLPIAWRAMTAALLLLSAVAPLVAPSSLAGLFDTLFGHSLRFFGLVAFHATLLTIPDSPGCGRLGGVSSGQNIPVVEKLTWSLLTLSWAVAGFFSMRIEQARVSRHSSQAVPLERPAYKGDAAFTLVDMMLVIALIGMLISIMIPALVAARASAVQVSCLNNLRSAGVAIATYSTANRDWIRCGSPGVEVGQNHAVFKPWTTMLDSRLAEAAETELVETMFNRSDTRCPTFDRSQVPVSYLMNAFSFDDPGDLYQTSTIGPTQIYKCRSPSTVFLIVEGNYAFLHRGGWPANSPKWSAYWQVCSFWGFDVVLGRSASLHPQSRSNALYFDFHAESLPVRTISLRNFDDGIRSHVNRLSWRNGYLGPAKQR